MILSASGSESILMPLPFASCSSLLMSFSKSFSLQYLENISDYGLNGIMYEFFNTEYNTKRIGWTAAIYLNDPSDLMMFQLRFDDDIMKIEEAILIDNL